jgi:hypothetical protein
MAGNRLRVIRLVLASPADVEPEWKSVERVVEEVNHGVARELGLRVEISNWRTDTFPGFHAEGPQGHVDEGLRIDSADILLAIFWTRFGTPVPGADSGTQHEIMRAIDAWRVAGRPQVMVYFKTARYSPKDQHEHSQWAKVREFRDAFPEGGLFGSFGSKPQFETQLRRDLTNAIRSFSKHSNSSSRSASSKTRDARRVEEDLSEPIPFTGELSFVPRSSSGSEHSFTLNVMLSNWSNQKLTDYDVELNIPTMFVTASQSPLVDRAVSTSAMTVLRVPFPPNAPPPPVFPGQTRDVLSLEYKITTNHVTDERTMLQQVWSVVRFADGRTLEVSAPITELHDTRFMNGLLQKIGDNVTVEAPRQSDIAYVAVQPRSKPNPFASGRARDVKKFLNR